MWGNHKGDVVTCDLPLFVKAWGMLKQPYPVSRFFFGFHFNYGRKISVQLNEDFFFFTSILHVFFKTKLSNRNIVSQLFCFTTLKSLISTGIKYRSDPLKKLGDFHRGCCYFLFFNFGIIRCACFSGEGATAHKLSKHYLTFLEPKIAIKI